MHIMQSRRDFLTTAVSGRRREHPWCPPFARRRGPAGDDHDPAGQDRRAFASRPCTSPRICCARKGSPTSATSNRDAGDRRGRRRDMRLRLRDSAWIAHPRMDAGEPITVLAGVHPGCFELFAHEPHPSHRRPEGQEGRRASALGSGEHLSGHHGGAGRARSRQGHRLGREPDGASRCSCSPKGRSTPSSAFRPSRRSCAPARSVT